MTIKIEDMIEIENIEDIPLGKDVLVYDGCDFSIDYVDVCTDSGRSYWANGSEATHYAELERGED